MSDRIPEDATSVADERRRIWELYEADDLDRVQATHELLRVAILDRRARRLAAALAAMSESGPGLSSDEQSL